MDNPDDALKSDHSPPPTDEPTQDELKSSPVSVDEADDLPEYEPLTPELVEDEAIRGDFMLRGAAVLLAVLLAWTVIDRTEVLVHVKTGQYLITHGFLPPATDVFSATAEGRPWVNLSWLWDLLVGVIYNTIGESGLSILSAAMAFATFWLVSRLSLPGVSTWWGSVCAVLAALACFPSLTVTPHIVTLLCITITLWLLFRWQWDASHSLWPIVGLFLLWGNLDGRAWIGGVLLLSFTTGAALDGLRTLPTDARKLSLETLGLVTIASLLALLVHPFLWETWLSPYWLYTVEYPALRDYVSSDLAFSFERFPAVAPRFWKDLSVFNGSALLLMAIASVTLLLNRERLRLSSAFALLAMNLIGIAGGRELAVASLVNAVIATVNCQEWYRANFRMSYSVDPRELMWSRGGRAVTVLAIFLLAFAAVSGHLAGAQGRRIGMGFSPQLKHELESYQTILDDAFDDRAFNFRLQQGDVLIWSGWKPFIDSRVRLYAGDDALIPQHLELRFQMREHDQPEDASDQLTWRDVFRNYEIYQALPRLTGDNPDHQTYHDLLMSPDWQLTSQGAATAIFTRTDTSNPELAQYLKEHDDAAFIDRFLRSDAPEDVATISRGVWPQAPTIYETSVYLPNWHESNASSVAEHYNFVRKVLVSKQEYNVAIALAYGTLRKAREGLRENPNDAAGYQTLAETYSFLRDIETAIQVEKNLPYPFPFRYYQIISACHQVLDCAPEDAVARFTLFEECSRESRHDLALKNLEEVLDLAAKTPGQVPDGIRVYAQRESTHENLEELRTIVAKFTEQIDTALQSAANRIQIAQSAFTAGFPLKALEVLEGDLTIVASDPSAQILMSLLLLEVGRTEEAFNQIESLRGSSLETQVPEWPILAAYCNHAADELGTARSTLAESHDRLVDAFTTALLEAAPLRFAGPMISSDGELEWGSGQLVSPLRQTQNVSALTTTVEMQLEQNELMRAFLSIEMGDNDDALSIFEALIRRQPSSVLRPMIEVYVQLLGGEPLPVAPDPETDSSTSMDYGELIVASEDGPSADVTSAGESSVQTAPPDPDLTSLPPVEESLQSRPLVPDDGDEDAGK
ncbi:MAG: hypothetical protein KDA52_06340 [Planctomycetaceae bacterium]|nr:hypothetical protein [Planctomycetaceae bacterium]